MRPSDIIFLGIVSASTCIHNNCTMNHTPTKLSCVHLKGASLCRDHCVRKDSDSWETVSSDSEKHRPKAKKPSISAKKPSISTQVKGRAQPSKNRMRSKKYEQYSLTSDDSDSPFIDYQTIKKAPERNQRKTRSHLLEFLRSHCIGIILALLLIAMIVVFICSHFKKDKTAMLDHKSDVNVVG